MFEDIIKSLNVELDGLSAKRVKCEELLAKLGEGEKKRQLAGKYDEICQAIDRAGLCISILRYDVSMQISEDFTEVRFPLPKPKDAWDELVKGSEQR